MATLTLHTPAIKKQEQKFPLLFCIYQNVNIFCKRTPEMRLHFRGSAYQPSKYRTGLPVAWAYSISERVLEPI